jgi:hypothetical protein
MIRLEKANQVQRITDDNERKRLVNEIKASGPTIKLIKEILSDKIAHLESQYESAVSDPYQLASLVRTVAELKKLTHLFEETTND